MTQAAARVVALLVFLMLDMLASWAILSAAGSFVKLDWIAAHETAWGRAIWLALFLYMAKGSIPSAARSAEKFAPRARADAQPTTAA